MNNKEFKGFIREKLEACSFVDWDRFTEWNYEGNKFVNVYGWIDRDDEYKDFVCIEFNRNDGKAFLVSTSSSEYSEKLLHIVEGVPMSEMDEEHVECKRVENLYPGIDNKIELGDKD